MSMGRVAILAAILVAIGAGVYLWPHEPPPLPPPSRAETQAGPPSAPQGPRYPVSAASPQPVPRLAQSDSTILDALAALDASGTVRGLFWPQEVIRHIVVTIDNLPRKTFAARLNPVRPPGGLLKAQGPDSALVLAPGNAERYRPYVRALEAIDTARLVAIYLQLYPLFQEAYVELGYPGGYFNDRLIEVIDVLLATPEIRDPPGLVVPHVLYEFADPELESLPAGQKLLIRMGPDNASRVIAKLRAIRSELVARADKHEGPP